MYIYIYIQRERERERERAREREREKEREREREPWRDSKRERELGCVGGVSVAMFVFACDFRVLLRTDAFTSEQWY